MTGARSAYRPIASLKNDLHPCDVTFHRISLSHPETLPLLNGTINQGHIVSISTPHAYISWPQETFTGNGTYQKLVNGAPFWCAAPSDNPAVEFLIFTPSQSEGLETGHALERNPHTLTGSGMVNHTLNRVPSRILHTFLFTAGSVHQLFQQ
jgi:hypothetical protein